MRQVVGRRNQPENHKNKLPEWSKDTEAGQTPAGSSGRAGRVPCPGLKLISPCSAPLEPRFPNTPFLSRFLLEKLILFHSLSSRTSQVIFPGHSSSSSCPGSLKCPAMPAGHKPLWNSLFQREFPLALAQAANTTRGQHGRAIPAVPRLTPFSTTRPAAAELKQII